MEKSLNATLLEVKNLKKSYRDGFQAVKGISFEVKKGEIFGILGPNGAGKTTTLEMIEGLRSITEGTIIFDGLNVAKQPYEVKEKIGIQLQSSSFFPNLKLIELLDMFSDLYGQSHDAMHLLKEVGLEEKAKSQVKELSGGQRQRFSIATTLVNKPLMIFLDEPTTGLDPQARRNLWELIQQIRDKGTTVIITTHYMDEAQILCDRIAIMDEGKIVALDTPKNLIDQLLARGFKARTEVPPATLEDVFIDLTGKEIRD
jgi:ABC-2 type transport system ATP-binding protein